MFLKRHLPLAHTESPFHPRRALPQREATLGFQTSAGLHMGSVTPRVTVTYFSPHPRERSSKVCLIDLLYLQYLDRCCFGFDNHAHSRRGRKSLWPPL